MYVDRACVRMLWAQASELYAFIKTLPSVSTATSFSQILFYNSTCHPHHILQVAPPPIPPPTFSHFQPASAHSPLVKSSFCLPVIPLHGFNPPFFPPSYCNLYINHHSSSLFLSLYFSSSLLPMLLCVGVKLRLYFPFWYCIVNALLHPIQLRCCGDTV